MTESDYVKLRRIAVRTGVDPERLATAVHDAVLFAFISRYKDVKDPRVFIDEATGDIWVLSEKKDVTPDDFVIEAKRVAHRTVLDMLDHYSPQVSHGRSSRFGALFAGVQQLIFWGYNLLYLGIIGVLSWNMYKQLSDDAFRETLLTEGWFVIILYLIMVTIPLTSIFAVVRKKWYTSPSRLMHIFFFLEIPVILLSFIFLNVKPTPATSVMVFLLFVVALPIVAFISSSVTAFAHKSRKVQLVYHLALQTVCIVGFYLIFLYSFFTPLIFGAVTYIFVDALSNIDLYSLLELVLLFVYFSFGAVVIFLLLGLVILPYGLMYRFVKLFHTTRVKVKREYGGERVLGYNVLLTVLLVIVGVLVSIQPKYDKLSSLLGDLKDGTYEEQELVAQDLLQKEDELMRMLDLMRSWDEKYLFKEDENVLTSAYGNIFHLDSEVSESINQVFLASAYPFVYHGPVDRQGMLADQFKRLFGQDVLHTRESRKNVSIVSRKIEATTDQTGIAATISVDDIFENTQTRQQEVIYEFSLPEEAVIHELFLGPNLEYPGIIAPKGAAARVYEREVQQTRDPALLEKIAPGQYRLRVFPIPGKNDTSTLKGKNQRVKFSYSVVGTTDGYALPVYSRSENIINNQENISYYLDGIQTTPRNGRFLTSSKVLENIGSFCEARIEIPFSSSSVIMPNSAILQIQNTVNCADTSQSTMFTQLVNKRIGLLYDASYTSTTSTALSQLSSLVREYPQVFEKNSFSLLKYNEKLSRAESINSTTIDEIVDIAHFGTSDLPSALQNMAGIANTYDAVVILSHSSSSADKVNATIPFLGTRVYLVHPADTPLEFGQNVHQQLLSVGGYRHFSIRDALNHFARQNAVFTSTDDRTLLQSGLLYSIFDIDNDSNIIITEYSDSVPLKSYQSTYPEPFENEGYIANRTSALSYLVANAYYSYGIRKYTTANFTNLSLVDKVHRFAERNHIVTPYSSLISLVNDTQYQNLVTESQKATRYSYGGVSSGSRPNFTIDIVRPSGAIQNINPAPLMMMGMGQDIALPVFDGNPGGGSGGFVDASPVSIATGSGVFGLLIVVTVLIVGIGLTGYTVNLLRKRVRKR